MCDSELKVFNTFTSERLDEVQKILSVHPWEFSEQQERQLHEGASGFIGILNLADGTYAHIRLTGDANPVAVVEITAVNQHPAAYRRAVKAALHQANTQCEGPVHLWRHQPFPVDLSDLGLALDRSLSHMERPAAGLPPTPPVPDGIRIRAFTPDDLEPFVLLNNAAFAHHPDQGGWTIPQAEERLAQEWVDYEGFYLAERTEGEYAGALVAFHWTKQHTKEDGTPAGEVYVIGVHPDAQGFGLGKVMLLHGLHALADGGAQTLDLWVDESETVPVALYTAMGFETVHRSQCYITS